MTISLAAEEVLHLGGFPVTNTLLTGFLVSAFLVIFSFLVIRRISLVPTGFQNIVELLIESFLDLVEKVSGSQKRRFFPFVATFFFFILFSNWTELLPGVGSLGFWREGQGEKVFIPFLRAATADLNTTLALALVSVAAVHILGFRELGVGKYLSKYFKNPLKEPMNAFVGLLELISEFAKIISFSFRLFGNIFAGEVLLIVVAFLAPLIAPLPFLGLEIFVGFIQALVFSLLTLVFLTMAVEEAH